MFCVISVVAQVNWETATKKQLLQIALHEDCELEYKYTACRELQLRYQWIEEMTTELVLLYGKGYTPLFIATELGVEEHVIYKKLNQLGLWKRRVEQ